MLAYLPPNPLSIVIAAVAAMAVGMLWYSPLLFGNEWLKLMGWSKKTLEKKKVGMAKTYAVSFGATLLEAFVLAKLMTLTKTTDTTSGAILGFWLWLGFVGPVQLTEVLFGGKKPKLFFLNTGYQLVVLLVMGALLTI